MKQSFKQTKNRDEPRNWRLREIEELEIEGDRGIEIEMRRGIYSGDHDRGSRTDDKRTRKELKALQDKIDILIADKATQEQLHFVGNPSQETPPVVHEVEGLEGQEELCFIKW
ncbi:hypothetical protein F2Q69_00037955 [Brassica cretica]|uniref:Uncharacterized protein n=1 Tax=Brassica cretica TaxID=69181 RepID=A0A8S9SMS1_BRACR|nr:hypothetical protein F2Q69_00037955 [Brassica cretica]